MKSKNVRTNYETAVLYFNAATSCWHLEAPFLRMPGQFWSVRKQSSLSHSSSWNHIYFHPLISSHESDHRFCFPFKDQPGLTHHSYSTYIPQLLWGFFLFSYTKSIWKGQEIPLVSTRHNLSYASEATQPFWHRRNSTAAPEKVHIYFPSQYRGIFLCHKARQLWVALQIKGELHQIILMGGEPSWTNLMWVVLLRLLSNTSCVEVYYSCLIIQLSG